MTDWEEEIYRLGATLAGVEHALEQERAAHEETKRALLEYENMLNWHVTCRRCASQLDSMYEETCRREQAEAAVINMTPVLAAARGYIDHLLDGDEGWLVLLAQEVNRYVKTLNEE